MCDTLAVIGRDRTLFAKNSDRPPSEVQLVERHPARPAGGSLRTQYLEINDAGAAAVIGARPDWLWGFEHGVNEHRVAVGNEEIWTTDDPHDLPDGLIGMDLVRLGLERARSAEEALDTITTLLERHGQGGIANNFLDEPYFSSFLVADASSAWVLETSAGTWAAREVDDGASISNRVSLGTDWSKASADVPAGADWDAWRDPTQDPAHADERLAVTGACVATGAAALGPADVAATLRHHGTRTWGAPGGDPTDVEPPPGSPAAHGTGVTVCQHVRDLSTTTSSMICSLPSDPDEPARAWFAPGSPCVSVFVPAFPPHHVAPQLADPETWKRFALLRDRVEADGAALEPIRAVTGPLEAELWAEADDIADQPDRHADFVERAALRVVEAADRLT